jgi:hypothetical protein
VILKFTTQKEIGNSPFFFRLPFSGQKFGHFSFIKILNAISPTGKGSGGDCGNWLQDHDCGKLFVIFFFPF